MLKFVAGRNLNAALTVNNNLLNRGIQPIINYISENTDSNKKQNIYNEYINIISNINSKSIIALKFSSLNFDENYIENLCIFAKSKQIKLIIDAEDDNNINNYREIVNNLITKYNKDNINVIKTYQMYRLDSLNELNDDLTFFNNRNIHISPKIVRGAYWNSEYKKGHLFVNKNDSDNNYNNAILKCYQKNNIYNILATHNTKSLKIGLELNKKKSIFQFANLMGMNDKYMDNLANNEKDFTTARYVPYGYYNEMIPYLTRRLYENMDSVKYILK